MNSHITQSFRSQLAALPESVRREAREAYMCFQADPWHPGLRFKRIQGTRNIHSVRIGSGYRAIGSRDGNDITWFWIGTHADYNNLLP